jgi:hypothetical protein
MGKHDASNTEQGLATPVQAERLIKAELWHLLVENRKHAWTIAIALFYLAGFLTLNAHLAQYGIAEFDIVSARYLTAAGNFTFFLFCYGLFAGRIVISIHDWITSVGRRLETTGPTGRVWQAVVMARSLSLPTISICFAAAVYCGTALQQAQPNAFYLVLGIALGLNYLMETSKFSSKYPRATELLELVIDLAGITVFFALGEGDLLNIFWLYFSISMYINYALDVMSRRTPGRDLYVFATLNAVFCVLTLALFFGSSLYKKIDHRLGGGMPQSITLTLDDKVLQMLDLLGGKKSAPLSAKMIYQTDKYIFLDDANRILRIWNEDVRLMRLERRVEAATGVKAASAHRAIALASPPFL